MPKYRVTHGSVTHPGTKKVHMGDKRKPGQGDVLELSEKDAARLVEGGHIEPMPADKKSEDKKPEAGKDGK